jgi:hypothetical protein
MTKGTELASAIACDDPRVIVLAVTLQQRQRFGRDDVRVQVDRAARHLV